MGIQLIFQRAVLRCELFPLEFFDFDGCFSPIDQKRAAVQYERYEDGNTQCEIKVIRCNLLQEILERNIVDIVTVGVTDDNYDQAGVNDHNDQSRTF